ncbi:UDP-glucose 4-epimerase [plant metagenome]|uniref:UDP-glucose 4-epimerase n=1 Tax=plant metagenome TaxID=1297885 RepID=A0A484T590_9ZZZZ
MNILVCGAHGFVGKAICEALGRAGHRVVKGVRQASQADELAIDYMQDVEPAAWLPRLRGIDVVVNAVGILTETAQRSFERVHRRAPIALFDAACQAGVTRIVQVSALGAQQGDTAYFRSKHAADAHLSGLLVAHHVLRPALVYGEAGASSRHFRALASSPVHPLPGGGRQRLRPILVDELAEIVVRLLAQAPAGREELDLVGGTEVEYRQMLAAYRASLGFAPAWRVSIPAGLIGLAAVAMDRLPGALLTRDTWRMLQAGNTASAARTAEVLAREPEGVETFIRPDDAPRLRAQALAGWRPALLRGALALTWLATAFFSACVHPIADSLALLARVGLQGSLAVAALSLAVALDVILGIATLARPGRRLWVAQMALIAAYSAIIAIALPEFLWHPFGPILKNVPIIALLLVLLSEEERS